MESFESTNCQQCKRLIYRVQAYKACYHCTRILPFPMRTGVICNLCFKKPLVQCQDCESFFCEKHKESKEHIRFGGNNFRDTCAKRTACLMRVTR